MVWRVKFSRVSTSQKIQCTNWDQLHGSLWWWIEKYGDVEWMIREDV